MREQQWGKTQKTPIGKKKLHPSQINNVRRHQEVACARCSRELLRGRNHAMRFDLSAASRTLRRRHVGETSGRTAPEAIIGLGAAPAKSGPPALSAEWLAKSVNGAPVSSGELLRRARRGGLSAVARFRRCLRAHSATRAWISTSMSSSRSSIMCLRRFARSFKRASSKDSREVLEQVARYLSIGFVVFIRICLQRPNEFSPMQSGEGQVTVDA